MKCPLRWLVLAAAATLAITGGAQQPKAQSDLSKIGRFLGKTSSKYMTKLVSLPNVDGKDSFFVEVVCAWTPGQEATPLKGLRLTGYHYIGSQTSVTESVFVDEDELPLLATGLRTIVSEAKPAEEVDFGDLGKEKVMTTVRVTSVEGASFAYDESLVGDYVVRIGGRGFQAAKPEVFSQLADRMDKAAALLKKITPAKQSGA